MALRIEYWPITKLPKQWKYWCRHLPKHRRYHVDDKQVDICDGYFNKWRDSTGGTWHSIPKTEKEFLEMCEYFKSIGTTDNRKDEKRYYEICSCYIGIEPHPHLFKSERKALNYLRQNASKYNRKAWYVYESFNSPTPRQEKE